CGACAEGGEEGGEFVCVAEAWGEVAGAGAAVGLDGVGEEVMEGGGGVHAAGAGAGEAAGAGEGHGSGAAGRCGVAVLVSRPARRAERVDDGGPDVAAASGGVFGVEDEDFGGGGCADLLDEVGVPGAGEADGLGEDGGWSVPGEAVECFGSGAERC